MKSIKMLAAAVLLPFMAVAVQALPFWTKKSSYVEGEYLYAVGIASELDKEEAARSAAFQNGLTEIKNFLLAEDIGNLQTVETQMTYTQRLPDGKFTVYRLIKVPLSSVKKYLDLKGETGESAIGGFDYAADSAAVAAASSSITVLTDTDTETGSVSIMPEDEDSLRDEYLAGQLDSASEADPVVLNQSITNITNIIIYNPEYANAYYTRAALQLSARNYAAAVEDINRALKFRRQNPATSGFRTEAEFFALRAKAEHDLGNYGGAAADLQRAAQLKTPMSADGFLYLPGKNTRPQIWAQNDIEELRRRFPSGGRAEALTTMRNAGSSAPAEIKKIGAPAKTQRGAGAVNTGARQRAQVRPGGDRAAQNRGTAREAVRPVQEKMRDKAVRENNSGARGKAARGPGVNKSKFSQVINL